MEFKIKRWKCIPRKALNFILNSKVHYFSPFAYKESVYTYILYFKSNVIGYALVEYNYDGVWYLHEVEIDEKYQNKGLGKKLIQKIIEDCKMISLQSYKSSYKFWIKMGFKKWDKIDNDLIPMANY